MPLGPASRARLAGGLLALLAGLGLVLGPGACSSAAALPPAGAAPRGVALPAQVSARAVSLPVGRAAADPAAGLPQPPSPRRRGLPVVLGLVAVLGLASLHVRLLLAEPLAAPDDRSRRMAAWLPADPSADLGPLSAQEGPARW